MTPRLGCALTLLLLAGCRVDVGAVPDIGAATPSPAYFVDHVWVDIFDQDKYACLSPSCHNARDQGHGYLLLYRDDNTRPSGATPFADWPPSWRENYWRSVQLVRCDVPEASRLVAVPEGKADPHPGDLVIYDPGDQARVEQTMRDWCSAK